MLLDQALGSREPLSRQSVVHGKLNAGIDPELRLPARMADVNVRAGLLPREEEEPISPIAKDGRTHAGIVPSPPSGIHVGPTCNRPPYLGHIRRRPSAAGRVSRAAGADRSPNGQ